MPRVESHICDNMPSTTDSRPNPLTSLMDAAVSRGIIDARQREQLHALADELAPPPASAGSTGERTATAASHATAAEARRAFNAITVAYSLGALLVLFALGWF